MGNLGYVVHEKKVFKKEVQTGFGFNTKCIEEEKVHCEHQYFGDELGAYEYFAKKLKQHQKAVKKQKEENEENLGKTEYYLLMAKFYLDSSSSTNLYVAKNGEVVKGK